MDTGLAGKGVVVTGASGGIGAACARLFAAEGANVLVHYHRGEERARVVADEIGGVPVARADLTIEADVDRLFADARAVLGSVDVVRPSPACGLPTTCPCGSCRWRGGRKRCART